jgi:1-acyl-sn-glycerol-3-phosphate acyltransferase
MLLRSHYRRIEVSGADRVPATGALLLVANHQNSLVDSLALLHGSPRPARPLAKAPLWKSRLVAPFLDALGAIPVFRPQDREENEGRGVRANDATFRACREALREGRAIALFPEGVSQPRPKLMPLRTGAARIALDAGVPVAVAPAGLVYEPPTRARRGALLVRFGEPFVVDGGAVGPARRGAIASTTRRIEAALRGLLAEAESQGDLEAFRVLRVAWDQERGVEPPATLEEDAERTRRFADGYAALRRDAPRALEALRAETDAYARALAAAGVMPETLDLRYTFGRVAAFVARESAFVLVATPLALLGGLVTWPARAVAGILAARASRGSEDVWAFARMAAIAVVFPVWTAGLAAAAGAAAGAGAAGATLVAMPAALFGYVAWRDHERWFRGRVRSFFLLVGGGLRRDLRARRRALCLRLADAAASISAARAPSSPDVA